MDLSTGINIEFPMPGIEPGPFGWKPSILATTSHETSIKDLSLQIPQFFFPGMLNPINIH